MSARLSRSGLSVPLSAVKGATESSCVCVCVSCFPQKATSASVRLQLLGDLRLRGLLALWRIHLTPVSAEVELEQAAVELERAFEVCDFEGDVVDIDQAWGRVVSFQGRIRWRSPNSCQRYPRAAAAR